MRRGKPLRQVSEKRAERGHERDLIVQRAFARDRWTCQAAASVVEVECAGRLDPHERIPRSAWSEGIYEFSNVICVCRAHHRWIDSHPTEAHALGLHGYAHERTDDAYTERH
jgi:hypothetical protein